MGETKRENERHDNARTPKLNHSGEIGKHSQILVMFLVQQHSPPRIHESELRNMLLSIRLNRPLTANRKP